MDLLSILNGRQREAVNPRTIANKVSCMLIMISGPAPAETVRQQEEHIEALNRSAATIFKQGHILLVGLHAARPVVAAGMADEYEAIMRISPALAGRCEAVLLVGESGGANRERAVFERRGRPVYSNVGEIPRAEQH